MTSSDKNIDISRYINQYINTNSISKYNFTKISIDNIDNNPLKNIYLKII